MSYKNDTKNYQKLSAPHENSEKANEAIDAFYEKVREAREEFKIADILIVIKDSVTYPDGDVGQFISHAQFGNQTNGESMAAYVYGKLQAERRELMNKLISGK